MTSTIRGRASLQLIRKRKTKDPIIFTTEINRFSRPMVGEFCNIEQVGDELAHHLTGIVLTVVGEGQLLIVIEEPLAHIPFHLSAHHVALIAYVIFAHTLYNIHKKQSCGNQRQSAQDDAAVSGKKRAGHCAQDLRIGQIHKADYSGTEEINKKDRFIRTIVGNKLFNSNA